MKLLPAFTGFLALAAPATAQTFEWIQSGSTSELWSLSQNWAPAGPPTTGSSVHIDRFEQPFLTGPTFDADATLANLTLDNNAFFGAISYGNPASAGRTLNVTGTTTLGTGIINALSCIEGCTYSLGTLANQSNATLTSGIFGVGTGFHPELGPAVIQWRGANIVANHGNVGLGPNGYLRDQDTGLDALRNFTTNHLGFGVVGRSYTIPNDFTNYGQLTVTINDFIYQFARIEIGGTFVNFDANTGVLNAGLIWLRGNYGGRAEFAFPGADIRTVAPNTTIMLEGDAAILDSLTGENGLRHLGELGGDLSVANALGLTPANGTLMHVQGSLDILTNGQITIAGDLQQFNGSQIHLGQGTGGPASLVITGHSTVNGRLLLDGTLDEKKDDLFFEALEHLLDVDSVTGGTGVIKGQTTVNGTLGPVRIPVDLRPRLTANPALLQRFVVQPEPAQARPAGAEPPLAAPGRLRVLGNLTFNNTATFVANLHGPTPGTEYSVLEQSGQDGKGAAYTVLLGGQLQVSLAPGFAPAPNAVFTLISGNFLDGEFTNARFGGRVSVANGTGTFRVQHTFRDGREHLVLTDFYADAFTVFNGMEKSDPVDWNQYFNWTNNTPGSVAFNLLIPSGFFTRSNGDFYGLDRLFIQAGSTHTLAGNTTLEFRRGVILESVAGFASGLNVGANESATLSTNALVSLGRHPNDGGAFSSLAAGLALVPSGLEASPMSITKESGGSLLLDGPITVFNGSTLTLDAQSSTVIGGFLLLNGSIGETQPKTPSPDGAAVVVEGGGVTRLTAANWYNGGTLVRNSCTLFPGGTFLSGGLSVENTEFSATGDGNVVVTSTAGADFDSDNTGILSGNGRIGGSVNFLGGYFLPGNSAYSGAAVGTLRLGGDLNFSAGPVHSGGLQNAAFLLDVDPQNPNPALRTDLVILESTVAQLNLSSVGLGLFLKSAPTPGSTFRFIDAPNLVGSGLVNGTFLGLPQNGVVSASYFDVSFDFFIQYGPTYVELVHLNPPPQSYRYQRLFFFTESELNNEPVRTGPFGDFNGDGVPNILAYALGVDPHHFPGARMPRASTRVVAPATPYGVLEITRPTPRLPDLQYLVAELTDLPTGFGPPIDIDDSALAARIFSRTDNGDGTETIVVKASAPLSATPHRFLRLEVNYTDSVGARPKR